MCLFTRLQHQFLSFRLMSHVSKVILCFCTFLYVGDDSASVLMLVVNLLKFNQLSTATR